MGVPHIHRSSISVSSLPTTLTRDRFAGTGARMLTLPRSGGPSSGVLLMT